jgi:exonuclease-1
MGITGKNARFSIRLPTGSGLTQNNTGLLPLLRSIHKPTHVRALAGQTIGIDAYDWLHRGTIACAIELAQGKPTRKHIEFALHRVRMLLHFGVTPYLVFDGDYLPSKAHTERGRAARRKESKRVGLDLLRMGRQSQAYQELQKAIDVTPTMARELIEELKRLDVPYVVAPFEADSQLAYLEQQGVISGVLSEDSDLLVFGVKRLFTKLDQYGECVLIDRADFTSCRDISLVGWSDREFRMMAMLSGCDYLPSIAGLGLKTTYRLVRKHKDLDKVIRAIQFDGKKTVPLGYLDAFTNAERTFLHQWVFCPEAKSFRHLNPLPAGLTAEDMPFLGKEVKPEEAAGVASGDLDPNTKQPIVLPQRFPERAIAQRMVSTPIEKHGKSIKDYFAGRTPLAELDPNSFTPSPSQQRLIQSQTNVSWSASQIPSARITAINRSLSISVPSSAPQPSRAPRLVSGFAVPGETPKRQRLCSDPAIGLAMEGGVSLEGATISRFFGQQPTQDSPTLRKKPSRRGDDEFELWSDDSIAKALAATSATSEVPTSDSTIIAPRKRKKLSVFSDTKVSAEEVPTTATEDSQSSSVSLDSTQAVFSQPETPFASITDDSQASLFGSLDRFRNPTSTSTSSLSRSQEASFTKRDKSTPAMRRTQSYPISSMHLSAVPNNTDDDDDDDHSGEDEEIQVGASSPPQQHQPSPSSSKLTSSRDLASSRTLIHNKHSRPSLQNSSTSKSSSAAVAVAAVLDATAGSEDLIIPNSPPYAAGRDHLDFDEARAQDKDEDDGEEEEEEEEISPGEKLNLGRFLFVGR